MRGESVDERPVLMVHRVGDHIPKTHPIRKVKWLVDTELKELEPLLDRMYSDLGRPGNTILRLLQSVHGGGGVSNLAMPMDAQLTRDVAIECMGRLDGSVAATVRVSCGLGSEFFVRYRRACGLVMAGFVSTINTMVRLQPELKPSDEEWQGVATQRRAAAPPPAGLQGQALVRAEVDVVVEHVRQLRKLEDHEGVLATAIEDFDEHLPRPIATIQDWGLQVRSL